MDEKFFFLSKSCIVWMILHLSRIFYHEMLSGKSLSPIEFLIFFFSVNVSCQATVLLVTTLGLSDMR